MVDDTFAIAVSEKVLVDLQLAPGKDLDEQYLAEVAQAEDASKALNAAMRLLEVRERSESEIRARLNQHEYAPSVIDSVIAKLRGYGFIDDAHFTSSWIQSRSRSQPAGVHKLRNELSQKGVARETIDNAVGAITEEDEIDLATKAISKRKLEKTSTFEERQAAYARDSGYLSRRGFSWFIIKTVLKSRYGPQPEEDEE